MCISADFLCIFALLYYTSSTLLYFEYFIILYFTHPKPLYFLATLGLIPVRLLNYITLSKVKVK
jgi:hypothetical protein